MSLLEALLQYLSTQSPRWPRPTDPTGQIIQEAQIPYTGQLPEQIAQEPFFDVMQRRHADPTNIPLRNAEHALYTQYMLQGLGRLRGVPAAMTAVPGYSFSKWMQQSQPPSVGRHLPYYQSTPPSLGEVYWGLAPLLGGMPGPHPNVGP